MKTKYSCFIVVLIFAISCNHTKQQQNKVVKSEESDVSWKEYKTSSGKTFIVRIDKSMGESINEVKIETKEFSAANEEYNLGTIDPVEKIFLADLDANGFEEIYLITRSAGSGSYSEIYGIASNKDKSATPIYVRPISEKQMEKGGVFEGFMGHNKFQIEEGKLINSFPVYLEGDTNSEPKGGDRKVAYELIAGEAGWILEANSIIEE